jgi:DNA end-binding protein Ku
MARSLWTGSLSFGLVNVPVRLFSGVVDRDVHFHQLDARSATRVEIRRVCSKEGTRVDLDEIVHGYEIGDTCVPLTDAELERLAPERTKTIDVEAFVDVASIDPEHFDHPYLLAPADDEGAARAYRLLAETMARDERAALGRFVLRSREYLVAVRSLSGVLTVTTLLFADEIRSPDAVGAARVTAEDRPSRTAVTRTRELLDRLTCDFDPADYPDRHRKRVQQLVARKRKGQEIEAAPEPQAPDAAPDLMAALQASLERLGATGS